MKISELKTRIFNIISPMQWMEGNELVWTMNYKDYI